jgi:hypothetical protein
MSALCSSLEKFLNFRDSFFYSISRSIAYFVVFEKRFSYWAQNNSCLLKIYIILNVKKETRPNNQVKETTKKSTLITMSFVALQQASRSFRNKSFKLHERSYLQKSVKRKMKTKFHSHHQWCYSTFEKFLSTICARCWLSDKRNVWTRQLIFDLKIFQSFDLNVSSSWN